MIRAPATGLPAGRTRWPCAAIEPASGPELRAPARCDCAAHAGAATSVKAATRVTVPINDMRFCASRLPGFAAIAHAATVRKSLCGGAPLRAWWNPPLRDVEADRRAR